MANELSGEWSLKHKLHPRTGFMIFFPGFVLLCLFILYLNSPNLQAAENGLLGLLLVLTVCAIAVGSQLWSDHGHAVAWNTEGLSIRPWGGRFLFRRHPVAFVPFKDVETVIFHPSPRGVPPRWPVLELVPQTRKAEAPFLIDPYHFTRQSLSVLVSELIECVPDLTFGKQAKRATVLLERLGGHPRE